MKHLVIRLLTLALFFAFLPLASFAAPGDAALLPIEGDEINAYAEQSVAVVGSALYILRHGEGLYSYHVGDDIPVMLMDLTNYDAAGTEKIRYIVGGGDKLYAMEVTCERLWAFNEARGVFEPALGLDASIIKYEPDNMPMSSVSRPRIIDGCLYLLVRDFITYKTAFKRFDLETGAAAEIDIDRLWDYAPYKDGKLLVNLGDWETSEIGIFDPETGHYEKKMDMDPNVSYGLQYDGETDTHYIWLSGEIHGSTSFGAWETVAYLPVTSYGGLSCALLPGGYFAADLQDSVRVRNVDPRYLTERLVKINGMQLQWEELTRRFAGENPDVSIAYSDVYFKSMEEMAAHMAGPGAADVYAVYLGGADLGGLYKRGCLADLSGNSAIAETVERMYPNIREALSYDGKIVAVPYVMEVSAFGVNVKAFEEMGLIPDDAPKTYYELLEFIGRWIDEYAADYPDLSLDEHGVFFYNDLVKAILNAWILYCQAQGEPLTFDAPVMRKLFAKLESISFKPLSGNDEAIPGISGSDEGFMPLFSLSNIISSGYSHNWEYEPAPLALDAGMPALLDAHVYVLLLNQKSADNEYAMRFIQYYTENMYPPARINTMPDENELIESMYYVKNIKLYQEQLSIRESLLEIAGEDIRPYIEEDIQNYKQMMENEEQYRWTASPEFIARYRSLYGNTSVVKANLLFLAYRFEIYTLINRYTGKQINGDQFIMELNRMLRIAQMEG